MEKSLMLNALKKHYGFTYDADFAKKLGISSQTLTNWKARNTFDIEILYTKCVDVNPDWLFTGKGDMLRKTHAYVEREAVLSVNEPDVTVQYATVDDRAGTGVTLNAIVEGLQEFVLEHLAAIEQTSTQELRAALGNKVFSVMNK